MNAWSSITAIAFILLVAGGCESNPAAPVQDEHEDATVDLSVDLSLSSSHVHILSEITFTVVATDHHGDRVTDFDTLRVERRATDSQTWRAIDLELNGTSYVGAYTFTSSGDYEIRVTGRRHHDTAMVTMFTMPEMVTAVPAHAEAGGYRIEFETFPGHLHQHSAATARFWVMEVDRNAQGVRPPITGLSPEIHCLESDASTETHQAVEVSPGVYEADHTFESVGDFVFGLHFTGSDSQPAEAEFTVKVVSAH